MRTPASAYVFGLVLLVLGASIALDIGIDLRLPIVKSTVALVCLIWGSHAIAVASANRRGHA